MQARRPRSCDTGEKLAILMMIFCYKKSLSSFIKNYSLISCSLKSII
ncbi:MAG: hypothetical protein LBP59_00370 [Planctomycetaceae bacterium]|nr:hypothetical protein [Planctomycetaceae bacterium]